MTIMRVSLVGASLSAERKQRLAQRLISAFSSRCCCAEARRLPVVTADRTFAKYGVETVC